MPRRAVPGAMPADVWRASAEGKRSSLFFPVKLVSGRGTSPGASVLVEGDDLKILHHLHDTIFPTVVLSLESIPNMPIGG